jgi:hypothetical protein
VAILSLKPCLFLLFFCDGWNVLFISLILFYVTSLDFNGIRKQELLIFKFWGCKNSDLLLISNYLRRFFAKNVICELNSTVEWQKG